jgi:hypothetical protein
MSIKSIVMGLARAVKKAEGQAAKVQKTFLTGFLQPIAVCFLSLKQC